MSKWDKLIQNILNMSKDIRFNELKSIGKLWLSWEKTDKRPYSPPKGFAVERRKLYNKKG